MPFSLHPGSGADARPEARPDPDPRAGAGRPHRLRDHLPAPRRLSLRARRRARSTADVHRRLATGALDRATCRPGPRSRRSSARSSIHTLDDLEARAARNEVAFRLAKLTLERYFRDDDGQRPALALPAAAGDHQALAGRVRRPARTTPSRSCCCSPSSRNDAADRIYQAIVAVDRRATPTLKPILRPYDTDRLDPLRRLRHHQARLRRPTPTSATSPTSSPTPAWEQKLAQALEDMDEVVALRQEPGPRLHHPLHARRRRARATSPTSSSASTTATAPTTCST